MRSNKYKTGQVVESYSFTNIKNDPHHAIDRALDRINHFGDVIGPDFLNELKNEIPDLEYMYDDDELDQRLSDQRREMSADFHDDLTNWTGELRELLKLHGEMGDVGDDPSALNDKIRLLSDALIRRLDKKIKALEYDI